MMIGEIREMIYDEKAKEGILCEGTEKGYEFRAVSFGLYPCAYIKIPPQHPFFKESYEEVTGQVDVHGGLTYSGNKVPFQNTINKNDWWIGWDYMHAGDYFVLGKTERGGHQWKTSEIIVEIYDVINQLEEIHEAAGGRGGSGYGANDTSNNMLKIKCDVCGFSFYPTRDEHYIAREEAKAGLCTTISNTETSLYDTFDCPLCGCQQIVAKRLRKYEEREDKREMQKCIGGECKYGKNECCSECDEKETCEEVCDGQNVNGECISKYEANDED